MYQIDQNYIDEVVSKANYDQIVTLLHNFGNFVLSSERKLLLGLEGIKDYSKVTESDIKNFDEFLRRHKGLKKQ